MILTVDVGNSLMTCAAVDDGRVTATRNVAPAEADDALPDVLRALAPTPDAVVVSSVWPEMLERVRPMLEAAGPVRVAGRDLAIPIENATREPERVGADRLLAALAAVNRWGSPALVVDFGTAITVDAVDGDARFLGGAIAPGAGLAARTLGERTAQLVVVDVAPPASVIGRDTEEALRSGVFLGTAHLVRGLMDDMATALGGRPCRIATGGEAGRFRDHVAFDHVAPDLVLLGLWDAWAESRGTD